MALTCSNLNVVSDFKAHFFFFFVILGELFYAANHLLLSKHTFEDVLKAYLL